MRRRRRMTYVEVSYRLVLGGLLVLSMASCGSDGGGDDHTAVPTASATLVAPTPTATPVAPTPQAATPSPTVTSTSAVAWATGAALLRSDDGGFSWTPTGPGLVHAVSYADRSTGWIVAATAPGAVLRTTDGGITWTDQRAGIVGLPPVLADVAAIDAARVVAVGQEDRSLPTMPGPAVLYSTDGGTTWHRAALPPLDPTMVEDIQLRSVCVGAAGVGLVTGFDVTDVEHTLVLATRDGGRSWDDATARVPTGFGAAAACGPDGRLWFLGPRSTVRMSVDGGATWEDRHGNLPGALRIRRGVFLPDGVGWLATSSGQSDQRLRVFVTHDDGATWVARLDVDGLGELASVGFDAIDDRSAIVVAQDARALQLRSSIGRSWATSDGGATWTAVEHPRPIDYLTDVDLVR